jgi:NADPH:quinone reductase-like Zn-dependent oxidoreductase
MKSLRFSEFGPPSVLRIEELPIPEPGPGEALVRVKAAAINPSDIGNVAGHFKKTTLPRTPGRDFAGIVAKGAHREADEVPGTEAVVNTKSENLRERVLELTAGKGVNAVFNTVGDPLFEPALQALAFGGRQVVITSPGNHRVTFNLVDFYHNFSRLLGVDSYGLTAQQVAQIAGELRPGFDAGSLKPFPIEIVPFEKAVEAYSRVADRRVKSKQVLNFDWRNGQQGASSEGKAVVSSQPPVAHTYPSCGAFPGTAAGSPRHSHAIRFF